jgi:predicted DCC family thiol-disulfide oxidoreductase YuxK
MSLPWRELRDRREPYSYRADALVPSFPDDKPILLFDGVCVLCSAFARFVSRHDPAAAIRFTAAQSPLGSALCRHYGLDPADPETTSLILDGRALGKLEAYAAVMHRLGPPWSLLRIALVLPQRLRDWLYDRIAKNRYRLFGRREACIVPDGSWRERVLE